METTSALSDLIFSGLPLKTLLLLLLLLLDNEGVHQAVCFSPTKKKLFDEANFNVSGISITGSKVGSNGTILINESTSVKIETLGFQPTFQLPCKTITEIINEVPVKSKTNVIGVVKLDEKTTVSVSGQDVTIRRGHLCDHTGNIKLTLWREYTNLLNNSSYMFSSLVKTQFNNTIELQSTNSTSVKQVEDITDFESPALDVKTTLCTFVGAHFVYNVSCMFCKERIPIDDSDTTKLVTCTGCNGSALLENLPQSKYWTVIVKINDVRIDMTITSAIINEYLSNVSNLKIDQMKLYLLTNKFMVTHDVLSGAVNKLVVESQSDQSENDMK